MNEELGRVIREAPLHTILIDRVGSKAYGISNPDSDTDYNGVYIIPLRRFLSSCGHGADTVVRHKEPDGTFHDIGKFCRLASQGNPNVLEAIWGASIAYNTVLGEELVSLKKAFLHRGSLKPYFGYYDSQANRLKSGHSLHTTGGQWNPKFGAHLLRLRFAARHLAVTGEVLVRLHGDAQYVVMRARNGKMLPEEVLSRGDALKELAQKAEKETKLPHLPDRKAIDDFVYRARMSTEEG